MKTIQLTRGYEAIVDDRDYDWLLSYKWQVNEAGNNKYARRTLPRRDGKQYSVFMHRMIMAVCPGVMVDHINRNGLDNRRRNLRIVTPSQSGANARPRRKGYKGISKSYNRWQARIRKDGKAIILGTYDNPEEAARAYDNAAMEIFGEYACTNRDLGLLI